MNEQGSPATAQSDVLSDIQLLRAVAIILVACAHLSLAVLVFRTVSGRLFDPGYVGVQLFFVISGYVVTRSLARTDYEPFTFLVRRAFRLYPALIVGLVLMGGTTLILEKYAVMHPKALGIVPPGHDFMKETVAALSGTYINLAGPRIGTNLLLWSLSVEFQYYAAVALLFLVLVPLRLTRNHKGQVLFAIAAAVYLFGVASRLTLHFTGNVFVFSTLPAFTPHPSLGAYLTYWDFDFLALGVMLASAPERWASLIWHWLGRATPFVLLFSALLIPTFGRTPFAQLSEGHPVRGLGFVVMGLLFGLLVLAASAPGRQFPVPSAVRRAGEYIGDRSYSFYLIHLCFAVLASVAWVTLGLPKIVWLSASVQAAMVVLATWLVGDCMFQWVEQPMIDLGRKVIRVLRRRKHEAPAVPLEPQINTSLPQPAVATAANES